MNKIISRMLIVVIMSIGSMGCATKYEVMAYNGTVGRISATKVILPSGEQLTFGEMNPDIDAGIWPVRGPMEGTAEVNWRDYTTGNKMQATAVVAPKYGHDSVIFLIHSNGTVTVETGRGLNGVSN
jgi:hypothetical protein